MDISTILPLLLAMKGGSNINVSSLLPLLPLPEGTKQLFEAFTQTGQGTSQNNSNAALASLLSAMGSRGTNNASTFSASDKNRQGINPFSKLQGFSGNEINDILFSVFESQKQ